MITTGCAYPCLSQQSTIIIPPNFCTEQRAAPLSIRKGITHVNCSCMQDIFLVSNFEMQAYRAADTLMQQYIYGQLPEHKEIILYKKLLQTCNDSQQDMLQTFDSSFKQTLSSLEYTVTGLKSTENLLNAAHTDLNNARLSLEIATKSLKNSKKRFFWKQFSAWAGGIVLGGLLVSVVK